MKIQLSASLAKIEKYERYSTVELTLDADSKGEKVTGSLTISIPNEKLRDLKFLAPLSVLIDEPK